MKSYKVVNTPELGKGTKRFFLELNENIPPE